MLLCFFVVFTPFCCKTCQSACKTCQSACKTCPSKDFFSYNALTNEKGIGTTCAQSCSQTMLGFSLLGAALATDSQLARTSASGSEAAGQQILRLEEMLEAGDVDGDKRISRAEAVRMLRNNEVAVSDTQTACLYQDASSVDSSNVIFEEASAVISLLGSFRLSSGYLNPGEVNLDNAGSRRVGTVRDCGAARLKDLSL